MLRLALQDATVARWTGKLFGHTAAGSTATAGIALRLSRFVPDPADVLLEQTGWPEAVEQAKESYRHAKKALRRAEVVVREANRRRKLQGGEMGPAEHSLQLRASAKQLREKVRGQQAEQGGVEWTDVLATVNVLETFGALRGEKKDGEQGWYALQPLGLIARDIRFENELWLAMILESDTLEVRAVLCCAFGAGRVGLVLPQQADIAGRVVWALEAYRQCRCLHEGPAVVPQCLFRRAVLAPCTVYVCVAVCSCVSRNEHFPGRRVAAPRDSATFHSMTLVALRWAFFCRFCV